MNNMWLWMSINAAIFGFMIPLVVEAIQYKAKPYVIVLMLIACIVTFSAWIDSLTNNFF